MKQTRLDYLRRCVRSVRFERMTPTWFGDEGLPQMYFDRAGNPITIGRWAALRECFTNEYKRVRSTKLPGGRWCSTVWLGMDHGYGKHRLIFETMVFVRKTEDATSEPMDEARYSTELEAIAGHEKMVDKWSHPQPTQSEAMA